MLLAAGGAAIVIAAGTAAWAVDLTNHRGRVARNVELAGHPIGGMNRAEVEEVVAGLATRYPGATVTVHTSGATFSSPAADFGVRVRQADTVAAALGAGRKGTLPGRIVRWITGFVSKPDAPVKVDVSRLKTAALVAERDQGPKQPATEPTLVVRAGHVVAVPGRDGHGIDPVAVVDGIRAAGSHGPSLSIRGRDRSTS